MRHFKVQAWISESDYELVKLDAEAIDTLSFGLGVLARLHKGARLSFLRRKINGEVWLPAVASYSGSARVSLLFTLRRAGSSDIRVIASIPWIPRRRSPRRSSSPLPDKSRGPWRGPDFPARTPASRRSALHTLAGKFS